MSGFEFDCNDFVEFLDNAQLSDEDIKKAMKKSIKVIEDKVVPNIPTKSGKMKKSEKTSIKQKEFGIEGEIKIPKWYTGFEEWGTSQQKHHVGFFENSVDNSIDEAIEVLEEELFKKII